MTFVHSTTIFVGATNVACRLPNAPDPAMPRPAGSVPCWPPFSLTRSSRGPLMALRQHERRPARTFIWPGRHLLVTYIRRATSMGSPIRRLSPAAAALALLLSGGCRLGAPEPHRLPTGVALDPAGTSIPLGSMPVSMCYSPDSSRIVAVLSGYREQGVQIIDSRSHRVLQTLVQPAAFVGAAISSHQGTLFVSGGNRDVVYEYQWYGGAATLVDSLALGPPPGVAGGRVYPAGLACSRDGFRLYVAENLAHSPAVLYL